MTQSFHLDALRLPQRVRLALIGTSCMAVLAILTMVIWMTREINGTAAGNARNLVVSSLGAEFERIEVLTADYSFWEQAYHWIESRDSDAMYDNIGSGATESDSFDFIYLLTGDNQLIESYFSPELPTLARLTNLSRSGLVADLQQLPADPYQVVSGYAKTIGGVAITAAGRVQPDDMTGIDPAALPVMVAGIVITNEKLARLELRSYLHQLTLHHPGGAAGNNLLTLTDRAGTPLGVLSWVPERPGNALFFRSLPVIVCLSLVLLTASVIVGRATARQAAALINERTVARTDPLTGMLNRAGLADVMGAPEMRAAQAAGRVALIYLDLDEFKQINDELGHAAGDYALQITANRLSQAIRSSDRVARIGGDEFVCVITDPSPLAAAREVMQRITSNTAVPVLIEGRSYRVGASAGVAVANAGEPWRQTLQHADNAMYRSKADRSGDATIHAAPQKRTKDGRAA